MRLDYAIMPTRLKRYHLFPDAIETKPHSPELALWGAVLTQALTLASLPLKRGYPERHEARFWVRSNETKEFSFLYLCDMFNLDAEELRRNVANGAYKTAYLNYRSDRF